MSHRHLAALWCGLPASTNFGRRAGWKPAPQHRTTQALLVLAASLALLTGAARAQPTTPPPTTAPAEPQPDQQPELTQDQLETLSTEAVEAFASGNLDRAAEILQKLIAADPGNFVHYYNLACVRSAQGRSDDAGELVVQAVEHGFTDVDLLRRDPSLAAARTSDAVTRLLENWPAILDRRIDTDLDRARERYGGRYTYTKDPELRLAFACAYDDETFAETKAEIRKVYDWAMTNVFGGVDDELAGPDDAWVLVVLPNQKDFQLWAAQTYGPAARGFSQAIGGHYAHDEKQLVTMDLGATIRHEFVHVIHWRCNTRHGQLHPVWVQEGLCSLIEDYDLGPDGELIPVESWRTNQARFLAETGHLLHLRDLCSIPRQRFTSSRPLAQYAQARVLFLFMYRAGKLRDWYTHFVEHYREDPTGIASIEAVFGEDIDGVNRRYTEFCRNLPKVPEEVKPGMPSLGVEIDATGTGEGLQIAAFVRRGSVGDLKQGDIITHIDHRPVRDYWELIRVLTSYEPGDTVTVDYRRVKLHQQTQVVLKAAQ